MWGTPAITFVNAAVIAPDHAVFPSLRVSGGRIAGIGVEPCARDVVIDLEGSVVLPGLINAHDHLELNSFRRLKWRERYDNVRDWIADFQPRFATDPHLVAARAANIGDRVWIGGLKNLLAGVTTVCHHNPLHHALRWRFPINVVRRFGLSHSLHIDGPGVAAAYRNTPATWPWIIHAAEGVDDEAKHEVDALSDLGCLGSNTVLVHGVAVDAQAAERVLARGASLVWCPTSNDFLFGRTAAVSPFAQHGRLALGTDSRLSGEGDLLDEMRAAHATGQVPAAAVVRAVTTHAADVLRLADAGRIAVGKSADLTVIRRVAADPFESAVQAGRADVRLTMVHGVAVVAERELARAFRRPRAAVPIRLDGAPRLLAARVARRVMSMALREPGLELAT